MCERDTARAPMQSLGGGLAVAVQCARDHSGNWPRRSRTCVPQLEQRVRRETPEKFIIERNDRLVAARVALAASAPEELPVDASRLVVFRQDDMQAACIAHRWM